MIYRKEVRKKLLNKGTFGWTLNAVGLDPISQMRPDLQYVGHGLRSYLPPCEFYNFLKTFKT